MIQPNDQLHADTRATYESPTLVEYGTITELTLAGAASQPEGSRPLPGKKP